MSASKPFWIRILLPGGDPDGLRTIEKSNWSGCGIMLPRALLAEAKKRREFDRTGVYLLSGAPEESGLPRVYIGEGDPIKQRLEKHVTEKDFWTSCIGFTSKDENLNKAHVQYLEARLIALAKAAKRCTLDNSNNPTLPSLSEADAADAEGFLSEMLLCLPVLGVSVFAAASAAPKPGATLYLNAKGIEAQGTETPQGFLVRTGGGAVLAEVPSIHAYMRELRSALIQNGVLVKSGTGYTFSQDYLFSSPSTAAGVILGRTANGRIEWKAKNGMTLKEMQDRL